MHQAQTTHERQGVQGRLKQAAGKACVKLLPVAPTQSFYRHSKQFACARPLQVLVCQDIDLDASERVYADLPDPQQLRHPYDRNGLTLKARDVFSCNVLDQVLKKYRGAAMAAS